MSPHTTPAPSALDAGSPEPAPGAPAAPVLELHGLQVAYPGPRGPVQAVSDVDLVLHAGQTLALVGESGSGKSTTASVLAGLADPAAQVGVERHTLFGTDLAGASEKTWRGLHGHRIGYIPQDAGTGLNPVRTVGSQLLEAVSGLVPGRGAARRRTAEVLEEVGLDPTRHASRYPHELSGGQRQRVLIALGLAARPGLVVADEPTSALDVTVQRQVLDLLESVVHRHQAALVLITHDLGVAEDRSDRIAVMRHSRIVEEGPTGRVLAAPEHPYTRELLEAVPRLPDSAQDQVPEGSPASTGRAPWDARSGAAAPAPPAPEPVVDVRGLRRSFGRGARSTLAVDDVSFRVEQGRTLGLVGESGSGKSTTARILVGLEGFDAGEATVLGQRLSGRATEARSLARRVRFVHQDPSAALDPRFSVGASLEEPLRGFGIGSAADRRRRVEEVLDLVALPASVADQRPRELSGGQRQRVSIARGLAVDPELLVLDEPVSALDVSVQARILDLLRELQDELGLAYVFISHDLAVVRSIADSVVLMSAGRVAEQGSAADVLGRPQSPVTRRLLDAVPGRRRAAARAGSHASSGVGAASPNP